MKQFCKRGHDTKVVGRSKNRMCKRCQLNKHLLWKKKNPEKNKKHYLEKNWRDHSIINPDGSQFTHINYDRLYQIQQGKCLICKRHQTELNKTLAVDHNHKTGIVRGLLCTSCNHAIGLFRESPDAFQNAINYLVDK